MTTSTIVRAFQRLTAIEYDARVLLEAVVVVVATWLCLGWWFDEPLVRGDGPRFFAPYIRSALEAGPAWTDHLYRFGVVGGSAMHPVAGTSPVTQLCSVLGVSTTTSMNISALLTQLSIGYFAIVLVEALIVAWTGALRRLSRFERIATVWCTAFAPAVGWRFAAGHENLLQGLVPWLVAIALWWSARSKTLSLTSVLVGWVCTFHAFNSLGQQTMVASAVFGAPVTIAAIFGGPGPRRIQREHVAVILTLGAALLCSAPRIWAMVQYHVADGRGIERSMFHAYGESNFRDWLTSLPWTTAAAERWPGAIPAHETNYPLGPLVLLGIAASPRDRGRELWLALAASALLTITFALDLEPVAGALREVPLVDAFRVPARSVLPLLVVLPIVFLACVWSRVAPPERGEFRAALVVALAALLLLGFVPSVLREVVAWSVSIALVLVLRNWQGRFRTAVWCGIALICSSGVHAFEERYDTVIPAERVEDEPKQIREELLARAPDLALPLVRAQLPERQPPFEKGTGLAAGVPTLDGVWYPPRRFVALLAAWWNENVSVAESDFELTNRARFDIVAQLYNVRYVLEPGGVLRTLPATNGPAWFVQKLIPMNDGREMIRVLRTPGVDVRAILRRFAWVMMDAMPEGLGSDPACAHATVDEVSIDSLGQTATLNVSLTGTCILVVGTNYTSILRAVDGNQRPLHTFPVDIALTGIVVPAGTEQVVLGPSSKSAWWWSGSIVLGCLALAAAVALRLSRLARPTSH